MQDERERLLAKVWCLWVRRRKPRNTDRGCAKLECSPRRGRQSRHHVEWRWPLLGHDVKMHTLSQPNQLMRYGAGGDEMLDSATTSGRSK